jgi:hypothetical protein
MKSKLLFMTVIICCAQYVNAQTEPGIKVDSITPSAPIISYPRNNIQWNVTSLLLFKNYNFSYERLVARKISIVASYRFMPSTYVKDVPLGRKIFENTTNGEDDNVDIKETLLSNQTITAEVRFYGGKHPGARGFYFAAYGRYVNLKSTYPYEYYDESDKLYPIPVQGKAKGIGGGVMIGAQWLIAKRIVLNWYILGAHYGSLNGTLNGTADLSGLSEEGKQEIQDDINNFLVIGSKQYINSTVNDNGVTGTIKGPFIGLRGGISLGIAF